MDLSTTRRRNEAFAGLAIGGACWAILALAYAFGLFSTFDLKLLDAKFRFRGERAASYSTALVLIRPNA